jgi:hypothetical protein
MRTTTFYTIFHGPTNCNVRLTHEVTEQEWQAAMDWMVGQANPVLRTGGFSPLVFER